MTSALITGITGQDGSYLAELLLDRGYDVHGLVRRSSVMARTRIDHLRGHERLELHYGEMTDASSLARTVEAIAPDEVYNLAAMSHVGVSFDMPEYTHATNAEGTVHLLDALLAVRRPFRLYQASSSELFGTSTEPRSEESEFHPRTPYGESKLAAHRAVTGARESDGVYAVSGIAFNHESPRRGENFVTRKITKSVAAIEAGIEKELHLGRLDAVRDWGFAPEYVEAMWLSLQQDEPRDYVLATGVGHTVQEFCQEAFSAAGLEWRDHVRFDDAFARPEDISVVVGDPTRARDELGWSATTQLPELTALMLEADRADLARLLR